MVLAQVWHLHDKYSPFLSAGNSAQLCILKKQRFIPTNCTLSTLTCGFIEWWSVDLNPKPTRSQKKHKFYLTPKLCKAPGFAEATVHVQRAGVTMLFLMAMQCLVKQVHDIDLAKGNSKQGRPECTILN